MKVRNQAKELRPTYHVQHRMISADVLAMITLTRPTASDRRVVYLADSHSGRWLNGTRVQVSRAEEENFQLHTYVHYWMCA